MTRLHPDWSSCSLEELLYLGSLLLSSNCCSLFGASALINGRFTWLELLWAVTLLGCMLPSTPPTCAASLWFAHQVNAAHSFRFDCFTRRRGWVENCFSHLQASFFPRRQSYYWIWESVRRSNISTHFLWSPSRSRNSGTLWSWAVTNLPRCPSKWVTQLVSCFGKLSLITQNVATYQNNKRFWREREKKMQIVSNPVHVFVWSVSAGNSWQQTPAQCFLQRTSVNLFSVLFKFVTLPVVVIDLNSNCHVVQKCLLSKIYAEHLLLCRTKVFLPCCAVFIEMIKEESVFMLHNNLHLITAPVLIIWGKEDQVIINHQD